MKSFFKKCNPQFSERTLDILHYPYKKGDDLKDIISFLKSRGFSKVDLQKITDIWNLKYPKENNLSRYIELVKTIKNSKSKLKKFALYNNLIDLGKKSDSLFMKSLLQSVGYGQIGNKGLLVKNIRDLLSINEIVYIADLKQYFVSENNRDNYYKLINDLFHLLREKIDDEKVIRILDTNFNFLDIKGEKIEFESDEKNWSLNELRENMNTSLYGTSFPSFWMKSAINRISDKEKREFVAKLEKNRILNEVNILDYWIFKDNLSPNDRVRSHVVDSIDNSYGKSIGADYVILELLEDGVFKKNLSSKNNDLKKPIFTLKRNLFHKALESGRETSYPVLKLIEMGEENPDFIWWLIL